MGRAKHTERAQPHARKKAAARELAAMSPDERWVADLDEQLLAACHPFQLDAVLDPSARISLLVGRGGAKTTTMRVRATRKLARISRGQILYVATSRPEAERLNWEPLKQLIDGLGLMDDFIFAEAKMRCVCKRTGAMYTFVGADDKKEVNKLRGQPFNEVQIDEAASFEISLLENILDRAVGPRLGERDGCFVLGGTPGHVLRGRFYDITRDGSDFHRPYRLRNEPDYANWIGWSSHAWSMLDIMALPDAAKRFAALVKNWLAALVEKERQKWSDDNPIWMREYLGKWAADNTTSMYAYRAHVDGKPFNRWDPHGGRKLEGLLALKTAIGALPRGLGDWLYGYGLDLGSRDPFALNILAFSPNDAMRRFFHVYSFEKRRMYARTIAELLIGTDAVALAVRGEVYEELGGLFGLTDWPAAIVADLAGLGETLIDELAKVYGIKIKAAEKKGKFGAIEVFNGDLVDGRMFVLADSPLEEQLAVLQWKPDEYGHPKEDKAAHNHSADSATYIRTEIGTMFSGAPPAPDKPDDGNSGRRDPHTVTKSEPKPKRDDWTDAPARSKKGGEFDGLIGDSDFSNIDEWGNQ